MANIGLQRTINQTIQQNQHGIQPNQQIINQN
jgi:hypothetical protein